MKLRILAVVAAFTMLSFTTKGQSTPKETITQYNEAMKTYVQRGDVSVFDGIFSNEMKELYSLIPDLPPEEAFNPERIVNSFKKVNCETEGIELHCICTTENGEFEELVLDRQGENWMIVGEKGKRITAVEVRETRALIEVLKSLDMRQGRPIHGPAGQKKI